MNKRRITLRLMGPSLTVAWLAVAVLLPTPARADWFRFDQQPELVELSTGWCSMELLPSGQPAICYVKYSGDYPDYTKELIYAWLDGDTWQAEVVASCTGEYVRFHSPCLALSPSGDPAIAYVYQPGWVDANELYYAWREDGEWTIELASVPEVVDVNQYVSLVLLGDGRPAIAYLAGVDWDIEGWARYTERVGPGTWQTQDVATLGLTTADMTPANLAVLPSGEAAMSFCYATWWDPYVELRYAAGPNFGWQFQQVVDAAENWWMGGSNGIAIGASGEPVIVYEAKLGEPTPRRELRIAEYTGANWVIEEVDADVVREGLPMKLSILPDGQPAFADDGVEFTWRDCRWHAVRALTGCSGGSFDMVVLPTGDVAVLQVGCEEVLLYTVGTRFYTGDMDCDGDVNLFDVGPFVLALGSAGNHEPFDTYYIQYPDCDPMLADANCDGTVNSFDIDPFVALITG